MFSDRTQNCTKKRQNTYLFVQYQDMERQKLPEKALKHGKRMSKRVGTEFAVKMVGSEKQFYPDMVYETELEPPGV